MLRTSRTVVLLPSTPGMVRKPGQKMPPQNRNLLFGYIHRRADESLAFYDSFGFSNRRTKSDFHAYSQYNRAVAELSEPLQILLADAPR